MAAAQLVFTFHDLVGFAVLAVVALCLAFFLLLQACSWVWGKICSILGWED